MNKNIYKAYDETGMVKLTLFNQINDDSLDPALKYAGQNLPLFWVLASTEWSTHFFKKFLMNKS